MDTSITMKLNSRSGSSPTGKNVNTNRRKTRSSSFVDYSCQPAALAMSVGADSKLFGGAGAGSNKPRRRASLVDYSKTRATMVSTPAQGDSKLKFRRSSSLIDYSKQKGEVVGGYLPDFQKSSSSSMRRASTGSGSNPDLGAALDQVDKLLNEPMTKDTTKIDLPTLNNNNNKSSNHSQENQKQEGVLSSSESGEDEDEEKSEEENRRGYLTGVATVSFRLKRTGGSDMAATDAQDDVLDAVNDSQTRLMSSLENFLDNSSHTDHSDSDATAIAANNNKTDAMKARGIHHHIRRTESLDTPDMTSPILSTRDVRTLRRTLSFNHHNKKPPSSAEMSPAQVRAKRAQSMKENAMQRESARTLLRQMSSKQLSSKQLFPTRRLSADNASTTSSKDMEQGSSSSGRRRFQRSQSHGRLSGGVRASSTTADAGKIPSTSDHPTATGSGKETPLARIRREAGRAALMTPVNTDRKYNRRRCGMMMTSGNSSSSDMGINTTISGGNLLDNDQVRAPRVMTTKQHHQSYNLLGGKSQYDEEDEEEEDPIVSAGMMMTGSSGFKDSSLQGPSLRQQQQHRNRTALSRLEKSIRS